MRSRLSNGARGARKDAPGRAPAAAPPLRLGAPRGDFLGGFAGRLFSGCCCCCCCLFWVGGLAGTALAGLGSLPPLVAPREPDERQRYRGLIRIYWIVFALATAKPLLLVVLGMGMAWWLLALFPIPQALLAGAVAMALAHGNPAARRAMWSRSWRVFTYGLAGYVLGVGILIAVFSGILR